MRGSGQLHLRRQDDKAQLIRVKGMDIDKIIKEVMEQVHAQSAGSNMVTDACCDVFEVPSRLEHSLLNPDVCMDKIREECANARRYCVAAVCVAPYYVSEAADSLRGSSVKVCAAIGFPHGAMSAAAKAAEARECIKNGAQELDVAMNILAVKSGRMSDARRDLEEIVSVAQGKAQVKAVFEHCVYTDDEKVSVLNMARSCGVDFVKIQNVLSGKGADVEDIRFAKEILGNNVKIKIDGGVKTLEKAQELICAGADRIGLTATVKIAQEALGAK